MSSFKIPPIPSKEVPKKRPLVPRVSLFISHGKIWGCGRVFSQKRPDGSYFKYDGGGYDAQGNVLPGEDPVFSPTEVTWDLDGERPIRIIHSTYRYYVITEYGNVYETGHISYDPNNPEYTNVELVPLVINSKVSLPDGREIRDISRGMSGGVAACDDQGKVWIIDERRIFGYGEPTSFREIPRVVNIQVVSCGGSHVLMVDNMGLAYSFGENDNNELGRVKENGDYSALPVTGIPEVSNIISVKASIGFSCFLASDGELWACGNIIENMLGFETSMRTESRCYQWPDLNSPMRDQVSGRLEIEEIYEYNGWLWFRKTNGDWWTAGVCTVKDVWAKSTITPGFLFGKPFFYPVPMPEYFGCKLLVLGRRCVWFANRNGQILVQGNSYESGLGLPLKKHSYVQANAQYPTVVPNFIYNPQRLNPGKNPNKRLPNTEEENTQGKRQKIQCSITDCGERANYKCKKCKKSYYCSKWCVGYDWTTLGHRKECYLKEKPLEKK